MTIVGTVIDDAYVKAQDPSIKIVTQGDRAYYALSGQSTYQKDASDLVNAYKEEYGNGISTLIMIYNATGTTLTLRGSHDYSGHIYKYPYDTTIENGEWSCVLHVHTSGWANGSIGEVGYNIGDGDHVPVGWCGWNNPFNSSDTAVADVYQEATYHDASWETILTKMESGGTNGTGGDNGNGYPVKYSIGEDSSPQFIVSFQKL